ncbi:MAG: hypothetical protein ACKV2O_17565 [Acidimicrobiales bacterium]
MAPAPASFVSSGDSSSDHQLQVGTDHGVLVVRSVNQADRPDPLLDRTIDDTSEPHGLRVRADLHVPDDLDPSTTMVQCHDGQLDIRIAMAATNAAPHQVSPTP